LHALDKLENPIDIVECLSRYASETLKAEV